MTLKKRVLFVKPPDRFLEDEFVYAQLGSHYLDSYLRSFDAPSDHLVLYEPPDVRQAREEGVIDQLSLDHLRMLHLTDGISSDVPFHADVFEDYDVVGLSVMSPQAPDAYLVSRLLRSQFPHIISVIGGSHARYYLDSVRSLPSDTAFDFIVPYDGWEPMRQIVFGDVSRDGSSQVLSHSLPQLTSLPAPTRPLDLMKKYTFSALGCPFTCYFCESGTEKVRKFSPSMIDDDLGVMATAHRELNHDSMAVMFFDDVGLMNPRQVRELSDLVSSHQFQTWRAFTHAYLVVRYNEDLLGSFHATGGRRIGMGLETGSQRSLDMIHKRNGQPQDVSEHYDAVRIANKLGIAVDAFTMIYPWEDETDLESTTAMVRFIAENPVHGTDELGRPLRNHVDATIMTPYQGTTFNDMIARGDMDGVRMKDNLDPGTLFYKGLSGGSGWPYLETRLSRERYEEEQAIRNAMRPAYR